jgi:hypothetical protein
VHGLAYLHARERGSTACVPQCERDKAQHACPNARDQCEREGGREHSTHTHVLTRLHVPPWGTKAPDSASVRVVDRSGALHAHMHFNQGVLGRLDTDRPLRARPTIGVGPHDRDRQCSMGACNACVPVS